MNAKELREKNVKELQTEVSELQRAYFLARMDKAKNSLENTASLKYRRRDVARAKTVLTEKIKGAAQ